MANHGQGVFETDTKRAEFNSEKAEREKLHIHKIRRGIFLDQAQLNSKLFQ